MEKVFLCVKKNLTNWIYQYADLEEKVFYKKCEVDILIWTSSGKIFFMCNKKNHINWIS